MKLLRICLALLVLAAATSFAGKNQGNNDTAPHSRDADHGHDRGDEDHDHATPAKEDGHLHHGGDVSTVAVTLWTDDMELFMEYPLLAAGEPGRFIIHLTVLDGFQPVRRGTAALLFVSPSGEVLEFETSSLLRDGIFTPSVRLPQAGRYEFVLTYHSESVQGEFHVDGFEVYASGDAIPESTVADAGEEISFLKEQQWKIPFATTGAERREVKRGTWAIAEVLPSADAYAEIVAPVDGIVQPAGSGGTTVPGSQVARDDVLATIAPPVQGDGWISSRLAFEQARRDFERAQRLEERNAISQRDLEVARNEYDARKAGFERLSGGGDADVLVLRSPISGKVIDWTMRPGQRVRAGDKLMAVVDPSVVWLQVNVYENEFRALGIPRGVWVNADRSGRGWSIPEADLRVLTTGAAIDPATRTVPVLIEVANASGRFKINETAPVELYSSEGDTATAVPRTAIYEDEGLDIVFVQTGGESFEKRTIRVGPHHAGWVSVLDGIRPGERVVTTGGYHVKLASTSAEIGHGHAH